MPEVFCATEAYCFYIYYYVYLVILRNNKFLLNCQFLFLVKKNQL